LYVYRFTSPIIESSARSQPAVFELAVKVPELELGCTATLRDATLDEGWWALLTRRQIECVRHSARHWRLRM
jgi:hypothetical protein